MVAPEQNRRGIQQQPQHRNILIHPPRTINIIAQGHMHCFRFICKECLNLLDVAVNIADYHRHNYPLLLSRQRRSWTVETSSGYGTEIYDRFAGNDSIHISTSRTANE